MIKIETNCDNCVHDKVCSFKDDVKSEQKDWFCNHYKESVGLTINEYSLFIDKINEMRGRFY